MGAFPGAPRSEGQSGQGSGKTGEGGLFPRLAESLGSEEKRPGQRLHGEEGRARGETRGGPRPGPGGSEGGGGGSSGGWASLRAGCTLLRPHEFLNCPFLSWLPDGCSGLRPPRPSSEARVRVWSSCRLLVLVDLELAAPLPLPPARCQTPSVFGCPPVGGAGGSQHFLITSCHRFCSTCAPGRSDFLRSWPSPTWAGVRAVVAVLLSHGKYPASEPNVCRPRCWGEISFLQVV